MKTRKLILLASAAVCVIIGVYYFAQPRCTTPIYNVPAKEPANQSYDEATALLNSGKDTYKAIALLKHAIAVDPNIAAYHESLALAYTDKAAFIFRALYFRHALKDARSSYLPTLLSWERDRVSNPTPGYTPPRPVEPPFRVVRLKDDCSIFVESDQQAINEIDGLRNASEPQWADALALATADSDRARIHYEHASADLIFVFCGDGNALIENTFSITSEENLRQKDVNRLESAGSELAMATRLQPQNAVYLAAAGVLGDYAVVFEPTSPLSSSPLATKKRYPASYHYFVQSLRLQPNNAGLWLKLAQEDHWNPKAERYDISQAYRTHPSNEFLLLCYISILYKTTHYNIDWATLPSSSEEWKALLSALDKSDALTAKTVEHLLVNTPTPVFYKEVTNEYPYPPALLRAAKEAYIEQRGELTYRFGEIALENDAHNIAITSKCLATQGNPEEGIALLQGLINGVNLMLTPDHFKAGPDRSEKLLEAAVGDAIMMITIFTQAEIANDYEPKAKAAIIDKALDDYNADSVVRIKENNKAAADPFDQYPYPY
jgi:hypothetical protein